ncbi:hypothetical protein SAP269_11090 [Spiroplasma ixodetis]|uniref:ISXO2-like transposase domain-containing protein n=1 Tax=Spiroplasma ixodetis TaxID=2141 RepID=A0ABN7BWA4_9MOLU
MGVTYKKAWRMGHENRTRIRNQDAGFIDDGTAQMDEMYLSHVGFIQQGRSLLDKTLIVGVYEKTNNKLIVKVLKKEDEKNLLWFALKNISTGCCLFTDSWKGYGSFKNFYHKHEIINHEVWYVSSTGVNTNQIESEWKHGNV